MAWKVNVSKSAEKELKKLGHSSVLKIVKYFRAIESWENPKQHGKGLKGNLKQYWRYRVGNYRIICEIKDGELIVLALKVGHRSDVYD